MELLPIFSPLATCLVDQYVIIGSITNTYATTLPNNVHKPNSSGVSFLVIRITKIIPVTTPIKETISAINPEYVTRMLFNIQIKYNYYINIE